MPQLVNKMVQRVGLVTLAALLAACNQVGEQTAVAAVKPANKRNMAQDFELKDADGKPVKLSSYKGKVVLLNFWATWCGPCKLEIPWFIEFEKTYGPQGFAVLGVAMDDDGWKEVKPYIQAKGVNYKVVVGDEATATKYGGVESLPTTFLIDREGRIGATHVGLVSKGDYKSDIEFLLGNKTGQTTGKPVNSDQAVNSGTPAVAVR